MDMQIRNKGKKHFYVMLLSIAAAIISIGLIVSNCFSNIKIDLEHQTRQSIADVTKQNVTALQSELKGKYGLLTGMARGLPEDLEGIQYQLDQMHEMRDLYRFKRMGYIMPNGKTITSDGYQTILSSWNFLEESLDGHIRISDVLPDTIDGSMTEINVITMPVYDAAGESVRGVLFASYETKMFRELMIIDSYDEKGVSCAILPNGSVMVGSDRAGFSEQDNLYELMLSYGESNREAVNTMKADLAAGRSGFIRYETDFDKYMYYMPVAVMDGEVNWYILTIVPTTILDARMEPINHNVWWLISLVLASILICVAVCAFNYMLQHQQLKKAAYIDNLTGGDNYNGFQFKMRQRKSQGYIVSLDLVEFKMINNTCGVERGDNLIRFIWNLLEGRLQEGELAGHISGDQFVLFLIESDMETVISRILKCKEAICELAVQLNIPHVIPKFGIFEMQDSDHSEDGYGKANLAKKSIGNVQECCYAVYDETFRQKRLREQWLEDQFDLAMAEGQFEVWYQPKFCPRTNRITGAEALSRWRGLDGQMMQPSEFIPLFERNGMITRLDEYVFRSVCQEQKNRLQDGQKPFPVSVNLSRLSLFAVGVVDRYRSIVEEIGLPMDLVLLEVTESAMVENSDVEDVIRQFVAAGFCMALDDFGCGYSSLATLNMKCFHSIKLDRSLINGIGDSDGEMLLHHVIQLAHSLHLNITAEGVEEEYQAEFLEQEDCDEIQGYYYFRPISQTEYEALLEK